MRKEPAVLAETNAMSVITTVIWRFGQKAVTGTLQKCKIRGADCARNHRPSPAFVLPGQRLQASLSQLNRRVEKQFAAPALAFYTLLFDLRTTLSLRPDRTLERLVKSNLQHG